MRPGVFLVLLVGCSSLLGIENPKPRDDGGPADDADGPADVPDDGGSPPQDHLAFSLASLRIARNQTARLHVLHFHLDGSSEDVTTAATYGSDDPGIATAEPGRVLATAQAGATMITASLGAAAPARLAVTVTPTLCHPVINELLTASAASQDEEWVEIYNPCGGGAIDVAGWTLDYRSATATGAVDSVLMTTLAGQLAPGEIRLYAGPDYGGISDGGWPGGILAQSTGAVGLRAGAMTTGTLIDAIAYGNVSPGHPFIESNPTPTMSNGRSASRLPFDGKDDGNGATDFAIVVSPTPRAPNAP